MSKEIERAVIGALLSPDKALTHGFNPLCNGAGFATLSAGPSQFDTYNSVSIPCVTGRALRRAQRVHSTGRSGWRGFNPLCNGAGFATESLTPAYDHVAWRFNPLCNGAGFATC